MRPARAVPYVPQAEAQLRAASRGVVISMGNTGQAAAVFHLRGSTPDAMPRHYTVEPRRLVSDAITVATPAYDLELHGPNGFVRGFKGSFAEGAAQVIVRASYDEGRNGITLMLTNMGRSRAEVMVRDAYLGHHMRQGLQAGESTARHWPLHQSHGWYDLSVTVDSDAQYEVRVAGHLETGRDSISDPLMGRVRLDHA